MKFMIITGYMNLAPDDVSAERLSPADGVLRLTKLGHSFRPSVYPTRELAGSEAAPGTDIYTVSMDIDAETVFEVLGVLPGAGRRYGTYTAGFFWEYADAFAAAAGLGLGGSRGDILIRPEITEIFSDLASWKARFNIATVSAGPASQDRAHPRNVAVIVAGPGTDA